eukprot:TRINITY_DN108_c0_g1_i1.p1 TRINITY_DN108_c0_g1~~TRINITY_DN108_c0_g1_i1.p1  ORF type:complete len:970 (-),score=304.90 TRINITY_DN108_c0_g1_i1:115-3024(-)
MKFGKVLEGQKVPTWSFYYLDYVNLKKEIVRKPASTAEHHQREQEFASHLERELQKINSFHSLKASELLHALKETKKDIAKQAKEQEDEDGQPNANWYEETKARLEAITNDFIKFDEYKHINIAAFIKLLKKHDKHQTNQLKGFWEIRLNKEPFVTSHPDIIDSILLKLSKCWYTAHQLHGEEKFDTKKTNGDVKQGQVFERTTTKYWVPQDKVLQVKAEVLKHLPVSSFNKKSSSLVTSVYYDSENLDLYHERLKRDEGSQVIRMRTYNEPPASTVFVERKVHHESWITEKSAKSRFPIKEKKLLKYLRGELKMDDKLNKLKSNNTISEKEYESTLQLATEIQNSVLTRKLQPTMTSRYERTAFQLEGNARVRVSLDTKLDLIMEHGYRNNRWGRDLTNDSAIPDSEIHHFPHAVLEIKLSLELGEEAPHWVKSLLAKEFIFTCGKFSKYIHGCAVLIPRKVNLLPPWFPMLEDTSNFKADDRILMHRDNSNYLTGRDRSRIMSKQNFPVVTGKNSEIKIDIPPTGKDVELVTMGKDKAVVEKSKKDVTSQPWFANMPIVGKNAKNKKKKKKVQAPMKIEPKTFFANERTFLQWMSFLVITQGIGITLISLSPFGMIRWAGLVFVIVSLLYMVYAITIFLIRRYKISRREKGPYDERFGPVGIVVCLMIGLIALLALYFSNYTMVCKGEPLLMFNFYRYNPSDLHYNPSTKKLITVGPNMLTYIETGGSHKTENWPVSGDLEAVTSVPSKSGFLYLGVEYPPAILEFDESSHSVTRTITLDLGSDITSQEGLEGLAFVPSSGHPNGGQFWAGNQKDGKIYVFDIDLTSSDSTAQLQESFAALPGLTGVSTLWYSEETDVVYGITDRKWLFAIDPATRAVKKTWAIGVGNPEGVVVLGKGPNFEMYLACDNCYEIWKFKFNYEDGIKSGLCGNSMTEVILASSDSDDTTESSTPAPAGSDDTDPDPNGR